MPADLYHSAMYSAEEGSRPQNHIRHSSSFFFLGHSLQASAALLTWFYRFSYMPTDPIAEQCFTDRFFIDFVCRVWVNDFPFIEIDTIKISLFKPLKHSVLILAYKSTR